MEPIEAYSVGVTHLHTDANVGIVVWMKCECQLQLETPSTVKRGVVRRAAIESAVFLETSLLEEGRDKLCR
jgi:hypothetical protein